MQLEVLAGPRGLAMLAGELRDNGMTVTYESPIEDRGAGEILAEWVVFYIAERTVIDGAPSTVESYFRVMAAVMKAAKRDRLIDESPCDGVRLPRSDRSKSALVPLTSEQVLALAGAVPARYRALVLA